MAKASGPQRPRRRFGRVRKLPSGHYQAGYLAPDGSVIYAERTFPTKAVADRFLVLTESEMLSGTWTAPERRRETVSEWAERWWRRDHLRRSTAVRDNGYLRRYILPELGALPLAEIDRETVQAWADKLGERLAPATVKQALLLFGQLVDGAVEDGLLRSRPWRRIVLPHQERAEMRFLDPPEIERLAAAIDPRYKALVIVGAYGGLRIGELAGLRCKSITPAGEVTVTETATEAEGVVTIGPPKTRAGIRNVVLPAGAAEVLAGHLAALVDQGPEAWVFPAPDGGVLRAASWRSRFWRPAVRLAALEPLRPHDLRHTAVALWIAAGIGVLEVSRLAGHTSTSFTLDRYGHLFPQSKRQSAAKLDRYLADLPVARISHDVGTEDVAQGGT